ncbi:uncharacterized protein [Clytia hemisphaerica]|uniref:Kazal-like domain-containing protein n=1 Tax=Clytia hemisphaerica TaxID=252671 RepID=A0A7M5U295_9CNID
MAFLLKYFCLFCMTDVIRSSQPPPLLLPGEALPLPELSLPAIDSFTTVINTFNDSADIEWPTYNNFTMYQITAINLVAKIQSREYTFYTSKGTLDGLEQGTNILKIKGGIFGQCSDQYADLLGKVGHVIIKESSPRRIEIPNFKVQFALDERLQMTFDASWDSMENAKDYLLTVSRTEDCVPNELSWVTNQTSLTGAWNGFDLEEPSTFLFDVRVNSNINESDTIRPKAPQIRNVIRNVGLLGVRVLSTGQHFIKVSIPAIPDNYFVIIHSPSDENYTVNRTPGAIQLSGLQVSTKYKFTVFSTKFRNDVFVSQTLEVFTGPAFPPTPPTLPPFLTFKPIKNEWAVKKINIYKNGIDIEFPYYNNYTSYQVDAVRKQPLPFQKTYIFNNTNKGSLDVPSGIILLKIIGIPGQCSDIIKEDTIGKTGIAVVNSLYPSRIDIQNFNVQVAWDKSMQPLFKASWDSVENAKDYILNYRNTEDCSTNEMSALIPRTSVIGPLERTGSTFVFHVRVQSTKPSTSSYRPVAPQLRKLVQEELADAQILKSGNNSITLLLGNDTEEYHILIGAKRLTAKPGRFVITNPPYDDQNTVFITVLSASFGDRLLKSLFTVQVCSQVCPAIIEGVCGSDGKTYSNQCQLEVAACKSHGKITKKNDGPCESKACSNKVCAHHKASPVCGSNKLTYENDCQLQYASCKSNRSITKEHEGACGDSVLLAMSVECSDHHQIDLAWEGPKSLTYNLIKSQKLNTTHYKIVGNQTLKGVTRHSLTCLKPNTTYSISLNVAHHNKNAKLYIINPPYLDVSTGYRSDGNIRCSNIFYEDQCTGKASSMASQIQITSLVFNLLFSFMVYYTVH